MAPAWGAASHNHSARLRVYQMALTESLQMNKVSVRAILAAAVICGAGMAAFGTDLIAFPDRADLPRFFCYLLVSIIASLRLRLPGTSAAISANVICVLTAIMNMSPGETMCLAVAGPLVHAACEAAGTKMLLQTVVDISSFAVATHAAYALYHWPPAQQLTDGTPLLFCATAACLFLITNTLMAVAVSLADHRRLAQVWRDCCLWSFPLYLLGAAIAGLLDMTKAKAYWHIPVVLVPISYSLYHLCRMYFGRLDEQKQHVLEISGLYLRTIEALALAIDAKDQTTYEHLRRVPVYAVEIGKALGLRDTELDALRAAAVLHDIGKLAVPEYIISKPGKLSPAEFELVKIHPVVGAEILEQVGFPYPVAPIVRAHHERWDGTGYPDGLRGRQIPLSARILSAVDCLDALASDRQYRAALPLDEAMKEITALSGKSFDPKVVAVLQWRYRELEEISKKQGGERSRVSKHIRIPQGTPAAGFADAVESGASRRSQEGDFLSLIAAARQEAQLFFELSQDLGNSLRLEDMLSMAAARLKNIVPYDSIAIRIKRDGRLVPEYVNGEAFLLFSSLEVPLGEGLSGWVAEYGQPLLNEDPAFEWVHLKRAPIYNTLRSALVVPLDGVNGRIGAITLYRTGVNAFSDQHLRILLAVSSKMSLAIENALRLQQAEQSAVTDYLTGLPNSRSLFLSLEAELARSQRTETALAVLVCDLDGFKQINDQCGHLVGNNVLRDVAAALRTHCREYDYVARMGGDEFVIVLPGSDARAVERRIDELGDLVCAVGRKTAGAEFLSISIGAAFYPADGADAERLLTEADKRMYKAKSRRKTARLAPAVQAAVV
jgi:diguanylate cyclase (GGDEF)-like protein/putative nucleotidyltransferase with HDIG domain